MGLLAFLATFVDGARFCFYSPSVWSKIQQMLFYVSLGKWYENFYSILLTYDIHLIVDLGV